MVPPLHLLVSQTSGSENIVWPRNSSSWKRKRKGKQAGTVTYIGSEMFRLTIPMSLDVFCDYIVGACGCVDFETAVLKQTGTMSVKLIRGRPTYLYLVEGSLLPMQMCAWKLSTNRGSPTYSHLHVMSMWTYVSGFCLIKNVVQLNDTKIIARPCKWLLGLGQGAVA